MRLLLFVVAAFFFSGMPTANAATSALVPSCDNVSGKCISPNYGLGVPSTTQPAANTPSAPTPLPGVVGSSDPVRTAISPGGALTKEAADQQQKMNEFMRATGMAQQTQNPAANDPRIRQYLEEKARASIKPPLILNDSDFPVDANIQSALPNGLSLSLLPKYLWGPKDVGHINDVLGYAPQEIPTHCQLRLDASMRTDKGVFRAIVYAGQKSVAKYDGSLQALRLTPRAVCAPPARPLPQTGGILRRAGDKLSVQLTNMVNCDVTKRNPASLEVEYAGDGAAKCYFSGGSGAP
jgi:hypothetical protein